MSEPERAAILRILDVNRNRGLEALRVVEEHARFALEAPGLAARLKQLRHALTGLLERDALRAALTERDVLGDPGRPEARADTRGRTGLGDVLAANLSRAKESLRALEEYAKPLDAEAAHELSRLRYALYGLEPELRTGPPALEGRGVYVLLGTADGRPGLLEQARACLDGGVRVFQLRVKGLGDRALLSLARELRALCAERDALLIVNDRPDLARLANAHGVHLGRDDLPAGEARRIVGPTQHVGASVHDADELRAALAEGATYAGIGTLFVSPTKPDLPAGGLERLEALAPACPLPIYGIGGITHANAGAVIAAGASGVAVASAVLDAADIGAAAAELVETVRAALAARPPA